MSHPVPPGRGIGLRAFAGALLAAAIGLCGVAAQGKHDFQVSAHKYAYRVSGTDAPEIRVQQGDLVRITFSTEDIPHSFTVEEYRIMHRAEPGKPVTFEFVADKVTPAAGFVIKCTLSVDPRCEKELRGRLIVEAKK